MLNELILKEMDNRKNSDKRIEMETDIMSKEK